MKNNIFKVKFIYKGLFFIFLSLSVQSLNGELNNTSRIIKIENNKKLNKKNNLLAEIKWTKNEINFNKRQKIIWEKTLQNGDNIDLFNPNLKISKLNQYTITSLNRSIIFDNNIVGPDVSWIVPLGLNWNKKYKFDFTARGHNTRIPEPKNKKFFAWNDGDAVGLISYQFLHHERSSFGLNFGVRSLYQGKQASGGSTGIASEGNSAGFRWDYKLSELSGIAFGAEQLVHFDKLTDTGRNIYLTASKAWWSKKYEGNNLFPLYIATAGIATGRMAVGTVKGFCSKFLGSSGTDLVNYPNLCWSPVFSVASVFNEKFSTYFEYNSRFFLLGTSYAPIDNVPIRGNFALILSDHVDNYKIHNGSEMNWVFNLSLGF